LELGGKNFLLNGGEERKSRGRVSPRRKERSKGPKGHRSGDHTRGRGKRPPERKMNNLS